MGKYIPKKVLKKMTGIVDGISYMVEHGNDMIDEMIEDTFDIAYYELEEKFEHCVDMFYKAYSPNKYVRTESLYYGYKIKRGKLSLSWEWDAKYLPNGWHRVDNDYLFDLTFMRGYHGGADKGEGHPQPGIPWYMLDGHWMKPAVRSIPINMRLENVIKDYKKDKRLQQIFDKEWKHIYYKYYKQSGLLNVLGKR